MKRFIASFFVVIAVFLSGCAITRNEVDVGGGKKAVYVKFTDSRQDGYNQTCRDIWQDGKFIESKCAQGPSLLQSTVSGSTQGALGQYLRRPDRFDNTNNLNNEQYQGQVQKQRQDQNQSQYQNVNPPMPGMD